MMEFNEDGSIKLPESLARKEYEHKNKLETQKCILIERDIQSFTAPKKCCLRITLSDAITDPRFIATIYENFREKASVPSKFMQIDDKHYDVLIGTDFRRCTDCQSLINRYREHLYGNIIEKKGLCTFEGFKKNFCYEDYFE